MTTANKITVLRILLIPFFVVELIYYVRSGIEGYRLAAILSFATASVLDGVDGYIARHYHQISELGKVLDPLADKLLLLSAIVTLSFNHGEHLGQIPLWLIGTIIGRDLLILLGLIVIHFTVGKVAVRPRYSGKIATVLQMVVVVMILLKWDVGQGALWLYYIALGAAVLTAIAGLSYTWDGMKQLASHPASSPTKSKTPERP
ncbi:MAG TPA: CDP-alcohol phosphatidyltransferase family protein [Verrucomicrobiae bacterium]|jgi:CDP-diacylglycerol--glycerol-3-phosphate 3-phosphatidyltransferase